MGGVQITSHIPLNTKLFLDIFGVNISKSMPPPVLTKSSTVRLGLVLPFSLVTEHFIVLILERTAKIDNQHRSYVLRFLVFFFFTLPYVIVLINYSSIYFSFCEQMS